MPQGQGNGFQSCRESIFFSKQSPFISNKLAVFNFHTTDLLLTPGCAGWGEGWGRERDSEIESPLVREEVEAPPRLLADPDLGR